MVDTSLAAPARPRVHGSTLRRALIALGAVLLVLGVVEFAHSGRADVASNSWSLDYDINLTAARRLVDRQDIYSARGSVATGVELIGRQMRVPYKDPFTSYIGTPVVALAHVPFLALDHDSGARLFRILGLLEAIAALILVAWALAPAARLPAALFGVAALFWGFPNVKSIAMGQTNGMVMLALALAIWATARQKWGLVGIGLGVAAALKITPVLLIVYLFVRGKRRVAWTASITVALLVVAAAVIGRPGQVVEWLFDIAPKVSKGAFSTYNQSIVGALARLTSTRTDFFAPGGPGTWYLLAYVLWGVTIVGLWWWRRGSAIDPLELGIVILVVLLAGPLTWDHYATWALIPFVLMCDLDRWRNCRPAEGAALLGTLVTAMWLFYRGIGLPSKAAVAMDWWLRVASVRYTAATLLLTVVAVVLLSRARAHDDSGPEWADDGAAPVGGALAVVAGRVHEWG
jgi:Glycosyltransferase family 87